MTATAKAYDFPVGVRWLSGALKYSTSIVPSKYG